MFRLVSVLILGYSFYVFSLKIHVQSVNMEGPSIEPAVSIIEVMKMMKENQLILERQQEMFNSLLRQQAPNVITAKDTRVQRNTPTKSQEQLNTPTKQQETNHGEIDESTAKKNGQSLNELDISEIPHETESNVLEETANKTSAEPVQAAGNETTQRNEEASSTSFVSQQPPQIVDKPQPIVREPSPVLGVLTKEEIKRREAKKAEKERNEAAKKAEKECKEAAQSRTPSSSPDFFGRAPSKSSSSPEASINESTQDMPNSSSSSDFLGHTPSEPSSSSDVSHRDGPQDQPSNATSSTTDEPQPKKVPMAGGKRKSAQGIRKKKRTPQLSRVLKEIRYLQNTTKLLIPRLSFQRVVRETMQQFTPEARIQSSAVAALHESAEALIVELFDDLTRVVNITGRVTVMPRDVNLALYFHEKFNSLLCRNGK